MSCASLGGRPGFPVPNSYYGLCGRKATLKRSAQSSGAVWVQVDILDSLSLIVPTVYVLVKQH